MAQCRFNISATSRLEILGSNSRLSDQYRFSVINGTHPTLRSDPYSPGAVIRALNNLGWVIPPEDQDCHELLHVLLTSLEEEAVRPKKVIYN